VSIRKATRSKNTMRKGSTALRLTTFTAAVGLAAAGLSPGPAAARSAGEGSPASSPARAAGATTTVIHGSIGPDGKVVRTATQEVVPLVPTPRGGSKQVRPPRPTPPPVKLDPTLAAVAKNPAAGATRNRVIVTLVNDIKVPLLPEVNSTLPRTAAANVQALARTQAIIADIAARRQPGYQALTADLARSGIRTLGTYWLTKGMVLDVPGSAVAALAQRADVAAPRPAPSRPPRTRPTTPGPW